MGSFFLYKSGCQIDSAEAVNVFQKKGFGQPITCTFLDWTLCFFEKQVSESSDFFMDENGFILVDGSAMYKNMKKEAVLRTLFEDYKNNQIDYSELNGHYNIVIGYKEHIMIISDPLVSKHMFCDNHYRFISTSMLACAFAIPEKLHINKNSVLEKMAISIIIAPDTLFEEIYCIDNHVAEKIHSTNPGIKFHFEKNTLSDAVTFGNNMEKCIDTQIRSLDRYFQQLKSYSHGQRIDTGLSAGYDSRLIFSMMAKHFPNQIHVHTHSTKGVHDKEKSVAEKLAALLELTCAEINTLPIGEIDYLEELMKENVYFFDGRSSFVIGGFNQTYTAGYRKKATEGCNLTLTGVGGEVYRNYYHVLRKNKSIAYYLKKYIINSKFKEAVGTEQYSQIISLILDKVYSRLEIDSQDKGHLLFRRYYSEIMMADGQGVMLDAYNQVSDCFAPFISMDILRNAYTDTDLIGFDGEFEAEMIKHINYDMAEITSSYRHNFVNIPKKYILKQILRALIPASIWNGAASVVKKQKVTSSDPYLQSVLDMCGFYQEAFDFFKEQFPDVDFNTLFSGEYELKNISMIVVTLYLLKDKIEP